MTHTIRELSQRKCLLRQNSCRKSMKPGSPQRPNSAMPPAVLEKIRRKAHLCGDGHAAHRTTPDPGSGDMLDTRQG